jgi:hypothetical protein
MNITDVQAAVIGYADRYDAEVSANFTTWVPIVEGRINSVLNTRFNLKDAVIPIITTSQKFDLPLDVLFLEQVVLWQNNTETVLQYASEQILISLATANSLRPFYTVTNSQIRIALGVLGDGTEELRLRYQQVVPPLLSVSENWLSKANPEVYTFGLLVELSAFVKDAEAASAWDARFKEALDNIENTDWMVQWAGKTTLVQRIG